jgi:hypothetical protein
MFSFRPASASFLQSMLKTFVVMGLTAAAVGLVCSCSPLIGWRSERRPRVSRYQPVTVGWNGSSDDHGRSPQVSPRVTVVAWVDADAINVKDLALKASEGARHYLGGMDEAGLDASAKARCRGLVTRLFASALMPTSGLPHFINPRNKEADSLYAQGMFLKSSANAEPPQSLTEDYIRKGDYRLINDFQVVLDPVLASRVPHQTARVGKTPLPCGLASETMLSEGIKAWAGEADEHPAMHGRRLCSPRLDSVMQISQGRLGKTGRNIQRLLTVNKNSAAPVTPWIWAAIEINKAGKLLPLRKQVFPTYYVYINGKMDPLRSATKQPSFIDFLRPKQLEYRQSDFDELSKDLIPGGCR